MKTIKRLWRSGPLGKFLVGCNAALSVLFVVALFAVLYREVLFQQQGIGVEQAKAGTTVTVPPSLTLTPSTAISSTATATEAQSPVARFTPPALTSEEIFNHLSPAVAFIDTPAKTGSGVLIGGGYVLTNYHVVWPFEKVRVVFPDGSEYTDVPVANWDALGDLAVVGPIETNVTPVSLTNGENLAIGSEVYLIGYPGEVDKFPQPTITRGLISRIREWKPLGVTYFQTDATIGGGQSGGILVSKSGEAIGISGATFSDAGFGLVASAADILPRVKRLLSGDDVSGLGARHLPSSGGQLKYPNVGLEHRWDSETYIVHESEDTKVSLEANSDQADVAFVVTDVTGKTEIIADDTSYGQEAGWFVTTTEAPYFVTVLEKSLHPALSQHISIKSDHNLIHLVDLDDGRGVRKGQTIIGSLDTPRDMDYYRLNLNAGEQVNVLVSSILFNPYLVIARADYKGKQLVTDDDSGGGMYGLDAELTYKAPQSGTFLIIVLDPTGQHAGGYFLQIEEPDENDPTPVAPPPTPTPISSAFGPMKMYESEDHPFTIQYPAGWTDNPTGIGSWQNTCALLTACFAGDSLLMISEEAMPKIVGTTLEDYVNLYIDFIKESDLYKLVSQKEFTTDQGLTGTILEIDFSGRLRLRRFIYVYKEVAFNATFVVQKEGASTLALTDYVFSTFKVTDLPPTIRKTTPTPTRTPPPAHTPSSPVNRDGDWAGTTEQGEVLAFKVAHGAITSLEVAYAQSSCPLRYISMEPFPIRGNRFQVTSSFPPLTVTGTFDPDGTASGVLDAGKSPCGEPLHISWTAHRQ